MISDSQIADYAADNVNAYLGIDYRKARAEIEERLAERRAALVILEEVRVLATTDRGTAKLLTDLRAAVSTDHYRALIDIALDQIRSES